MPLDGNSRDFYNIRPWTTITVQSTVVKRVITFSGPSYHTSHPRRWSSIISRPWEYPRHAKAFHYHDWFPLQRYTAADRFLLVYVFAARERPKLPGVLRLLSIACVLVWAVAWLSLHTYIHTYTFTHPLTHKHIYKHKQTHTQVKNSIITTGRQMVRMSVKDGLAYHSE